jgi:predicted small secreted protein
MPGIIDDANFIFKKALNVVDKTTGLPVTQYVYEDTKSGKKVKSKKEKKGKSGKLINSFIELKKKTYPKIRINHQAKKIKKTEGASDYPELIQFNNKAFLSWNTIKDGYQFIALE